MKTIEVTEEFYFAAKDLANYVDGDDSEYSALKEALREGISEKECILHKAAIVGGWEDCYEETVHNYKRIIDQAELDKHIRLN